MFNIIKQISYAIKQNESELDQIKMLTILRAIFSPPPSHPSKLNLYLQKYFHFWAEQIKDAIIWSI